MSCLKTQILNKFKNNRKDIYRIIIFKLTIYPFYFFGSFFKFQINIEKLIIKFPIKSLYKKIQNNTQIEEYKIIDCIII
jgi:hypothetical protein